MELALRAARAEDAPALAAAARVHAAVPGRLASTPAELTDERLRRTIEDLTADPRGCFLVATAGEEPVGYGLLDPMGLRSTAHVVHLTLVVRAGFEGRGVGRALVEELLAWARATPEVEKVELRVRSVNERAVRLYRALGFVDEGLHRRRVRAADGVYFDDLSMALFVDGSDAPAGQ